MKNLVGNWQVSPVYSYETPEYYTVQSGIDSNLNGDSAPDRTIINNTGTAHTGSDVYGLDRAGNRINLPASNANAAPIVAYVAINPGARYIRAGYGAFANGGRNTEATRPINNVDLSIVKRFNITERIALELSGQALNVFNHAQFIPGSINDSRSGGHFLHWHTKLRLRQQLSVQQSRACFQQQSTQLDPGREVLVLREPNVSPLGRLTEGNLW